MIRNLALVLTLSAFALSAEAEEPVQKGINSINRQTAEAHIRFLASDALQGREAGTRNGQIAALYIASHLQSLGIAPFGESYLHPFVAAHAERQKRGARWEVHPDSISRLEAGVHQKLHLNNVLGVIPGRKSDEYVIVGAHYDHLGLDPLLEGDSIYNGADDNASGVSAVLQIARAFVQSGQQPERTVIVAFWDGEEKGLLGSRAFVQSFAAIGRVKGYLNFDMIGRNHDESHPQQFVYFYTEAHPAFGDWLREAISQYDLQLSPDYHPWDNPIGGSDNSSFAQEGIPIIWYHTDGHLDYHQPSDHADRINWSKLVDITKAAFLNMWNFANKKTY